MKFAIFDLDGVIIDSRLANYHAFAAGVVAAGLPQPREADVVNLIGLPALDMLTRLGCPATRARDIYDEVVKPYYLEHLPRLAQPVREAARTLEELRRRGFRLGACTSGDRALQENALRSVGLATHFEAMQTPDDSSFSKPHTRYLGELLERMGGPVEQIWHIEDSEIGLKMGLDFGATTVFADYGFGKPGDYLPHHRISSLEVLLELV